MLKLKKYDVEPLVHGSPVSDPQISHDGSKILFVRSIVKMEDDGDESHIWVISSDGGEPRQFTFCDGKDTTPVWSHDGETIYFTSTRAHGGEEKRPRIWAMPVGGGEARCLFETSGTVTGLKLSQDGRRFLFLSRTEEESETPEEKVGDVMWITKLRYRMDGMGYYPYTRNHLFTVSAEGGEPQQLTSGPFDVSSADWSPDGGEIAYVANKEDGDYTRIRDIFIVPSEGGSPRKLTDGKTMISSVAWSLDGELLAYTGRIPVDPEHPMYGSTDIWVMPPGGGEARNLTSAFDRTVGRYGSSVFWGDAGQIYFRAPNHGAYNLYRVGVETGDVEHVIEGKRTLASFSLCADSSRVAFAATDVAWPQEVWVHDAGGSRRLTSLNSEVMEAWSISEPEEFWFTASDGVEVQGWIVKPWGYEEGNKYPMILEIHGGPHGAYGFKLGTAEHEFQLLARNGYVVVYTNPRDSVGYGEEFAGIAEGSWGGRDFMDLMQAVDHVLKTYAFIDEERLGVAGGSFGGFMTNWTVGHTDRFKAAVTMRSVCNWYSQVGTSDVSWGHTGVGAGDEPWEIPERYLELSPITYADKINTPLLIIHSEFDFRCPLSEGEQLYYAMKRQKKETEFIRFANNSHGLGRTGKPSLRTERLRHIVRWFDRYLK
ncbi:S9 family peptidase [Candidatus Bathyarchaeota archaeon]|nr:S9 family peptidase [Candidatus Bathyarchaeota archaeon]